MSEKITKELLITGSVDVAKVTKKEIVEFAIGLNLPIEFTENQKKADMLNALCEVMDGKKPAITDGASGGATGGGDGKTQDNPNTPPTEKELAEAKAKEDAEAKAIADKKLAEEEAKAKEDADKKLPGYLVRRKKRIDAEVAKTNPVGSEGAALTEYQKRRMGK